MRELKRCLPLVSSCSEFGRSVTVISLLCVSGAGGRLGSVHCLAAELTSASRSTPLPSTELAELGSGDLTVKVNVNFKRICFYAFTFFLFHDDRYI